MIAAWFASLRRQHGLRADLTALALGLVSALALPPVHLVPALLIGIPGLLAMLERVDRSAQAWRRGWWFGFGLNLAGLYWVTEAILFEAQRYWWLIPLAAPALAAVMAVFIAFPCWIAAHVRPGWSRALAFAGAWVLFDIARQFVATGFPWNPLGSVWAFPGWAGDMMIQPAAWVGVHGLTLATVLLAGVSAQGRRGLGVCLIAVSCWAGFGAARLSEAGSTGGGSVVVIVQGNIPQGQKWSRERAVGIFREYLTLTANAVALAGDRPVIVVWPETASPFPLEIDQAAREAITDASAGNPVLVGGVRFDSEGRPRNTLFALVAGGAIATLYDKWHLVPFGEYQPDWLPLGIQLVPGGGFASGPGPRTLHIPGVPPVGPLICYETIFPGQVVAGDDRPAWLVNVTNDAWFGNSSGPRQHLASSRLRSVEEGLPLVRVANTGISAGFDAYGHEVGRIGLNTTGTLQIVLPGALPGTPFARVGLAAPMLLAILALVTGAVTPRYRRH